MSRGFEFKQLMRAYRAGAINETDFEREMKNLENGSANGNGSGGFVAFGRTYASEREAVMRFLETVSPAETNGGEAIRKWLEVCTTECIRGGLQMVAEREAYHGRAFERRLKELGGTFVNKPPEEYTKSLAYLGNASVSDLEKLQRGAKRFPNPDETIRPLFEFAELLKEDLQTKEMVNLFAQDELSTLKWQNALCEKLSAMQHGDRAAAN